MMYDYQNQKDLVLNLYARLKQKGIDSFVEELEAIAAPNFTWRGYHPFNELRGVQSVGDVFYRPLAHALTGLTRRLDVFMAGQNMYHPAQIWVCSMGHLIGLFDHPWLGIRPTGKLTMLRYCEFNRIEDGQIVETAMYFDIPHLMVQAGQNPFPPQTGAHLVQPGPAPHNGLLFAHQDPQEGEKTLDLIGKMVADLGEWQNDLPLVKELALTWHKNMLWWGPAGIGATFTIERYAKQHSAIFRKSFSNRSKTSHICRMAEGHFGGFFGWPNFSATHTGGFMGLPGSDKPAEFRVIDIYRRESNKLAENWVFIDLLHIMKQMGVDVLERNEMLHSFAR